MANNKWFVSAYTPLMSSIEVSDLVYFVYDHPIDCECCMAITVSNTNRVALEGANAEYAS